MSCLGAGGGGVLALSYHVRHTRRQVGIRAQAFGIALQTEQPTGLVTIFLLHGFGDRQAQVNVGDTVEAFLIHLLQRSIAHQQHNNADSITDSAQYKQCRFAPVAKVLTEPRVATAEHQNAVGGLHILGESVLAWSGAGPRVRSVWGEEESRQDNRQTLG